LRAGAGDLLLKSSRLSVLPPAAEEKVQGVRADDGGLSLKASRLSVVACATEEKVLRLGDLPPAAEEKALRLGDLPPAAEEKALRMGGGAGECSIKSSLPDACSTTIIFGWRVKKSFN